MHEISHSKEILRNSDSFTLDFSPIVRVGVSRSPSLHFRIPRVVKFPLRMVAAVKSDYLSSNLASKGRSPFERKGRGEEGLVVQTDATPELDSIIPTSLNSTFSFSAFSCSSGTQADPYDALFLLLRTDLFCLLIFA